MISPKPIYPSEVFDFFSANVQLPPVAKLPKISTLSLWLARLRKKSKSPFAIDGKGHTLAIVDKESSMLSNLWFIGDVHGDITALNMAFQFIDWWTLANGAVMPTIVSLGDLFDRGRHSLQVILAFLGRAMNGPGKVALIGGNHDVALHYDVNNGTFYSEANPAEYAQWLNLHLGNSELVKFNQELIALIKTVPLAVAFPGGLLAAHGAVPHSDAWHEIECIADLDKCNPRNDFVWNRLHETLPLKRPHRPHSSQLGMIDFRDFIRLLQKISGFETTTFLRGHDHYVERVKIFKKYLSFCNVVTINTASTIEDGVYSKDVSLKFTPPCVARYIKNEPPVIYRLH